MGIRSWKRCGATQKRQQSCGQRGATKDTIGKHSDTCSSTCTFTCTRHMSTHISTKCTNRLKALRAQRKVSFGFEKHDSRQRVRQVRALVLCMSGAHRPVNQGINLTPVEQILKLSE